mgnify:CR=1 FL=1
MLQLTGTYYEGKGYPEETIPTDRPIKVRVVFEEDVVIQEEKILQFSDWSFAKTREILKYTKGCWGDTVKTQELFPGLGILK